jgi:cyclophilin family peptidyl-prolyl cis-trans isomerase/HEAT repeat protein
VTALVGLTQDAQTDLETAALYSLGRLRAPAAGPRLVDALRDVSAPVRALAARALTRKYATDAGLPAEAVVADLARATNDPDAGVRIQALRSLATYPKVRADRLLSLLEDPVLNVQVQAVETLAELGDPAAAPELERLVTAKGSLARQQAALAALAQVDSARFAAAVAPWAGSPDWRRRAAAARAWASRGPPRSFLNDRDSRVVAAALQEWSTHAAPGDSALAEASRGLIRHPDVAVRSLAADQLSATPRSGDLAAFVGLYRAAQRDTVPDAALSALNGVLAVARLDSARAESIEKSALADLPVPRNPVIREWADRQWPLAAAQWGPAYPLQPPKSLDDYRDIVRRLVLSSSPDRTPQLTLEVEHLGTIGLELWGPEAPLTVANFLQLTERHFFDGLRFHRVVPGFVVQAGDPRGDGWGGSVDVIRDEINRQRYGAYVLGMALSGPDTGTSQWFITLASQPHLDGTYTAFGKVTDGVPVLLRITQDDQIRSLHR